ACQRMWLAPLTVPEGELTLECDTLKTQAQAGSLENRQCVLRDLLRFGGVWTRRMGNPFFNKKELRPKLLRAQQAPAIRRTTHAGRTLGDSGIESLEGP